MGRITSVGEWARMNDYIELSDVELRKAIAKIAGYQVIEYNDLFYMVDPDKTLEQTTRGVDRHFHAYRNYSSEQEAWAFSKQPPNYIEDLNACWLLFKSFAISWEVRVEAIKDNYCCVIHLPSAGVLFTVADTPAHAMCYGFLKWNKLENK
jgi:hypothetical protein